ncbi:MAG: flagellar biosynthetic protein FliO [Armatimonadota bacterium]
MNKTKNILLFLIVIALVLNCFCACCAQEKSEGSYFDKAEVGSERFNPVSKIPVTVISLILVGLLAYFILKFMGSKNMLPNVMQGRNIKVIDRQLLSQKHSLYIIKVLHEYLLIGVSDNNISTLKELNKHEAEEFLKEKEESQTADPKKYWSKFFSSKIPFMKSKE